MAFCAPILPVVPSSTPCSSCDLRPQTCAQTLVFDIFEMCDLASYGVSLQVPAMRRRSVFTAQVRSVAFAMTSLFVNTFFRTNCHTQNQQVQDCFVCVDTLVAVWLKTARPAPNFFLAELLQSKSCTQPLGLPSVHLRASARFFRLSSSFHGATKFHDLRGPVSCWEKLLLDCSLLTGWIMSVRHFPSIVLTPCFSTHSCPCLFLGGNDCYCFLGGQWWLRQPSWWVGEGVVLAPFGGGGDCPWLLWWNWLPWPPLVAVVVLASFRLVGRGGRDVAMFGGHLGRSSGHLRRSR